MVIIPQGLDATGRTVPEGNYARRLTAGVIEALNADIAAVMGPGWPCTTCDADPCVCPCIADCPDAEGPCPGRGWSNHACDPTNEGDCCDICSESRLGHQCWGCVGTEGHDNRQSAAFVAAGRHAIAWFYGREHTYTPAELTQFAYDEYGTELADMAMLLAARGWLKVEGGTVGVGPRWMEHFVTGCAHHPHDPVFDCPICGDVSLAGGERAAVSQLGLPFDYSDE